MKLSKLKQLIKEEFLKEIKVETPPNIEEFDWISELYNFFKNDQGIFKNSGIDSVIKNNLSDIVDMIWEKYSETKHGWMEGDIEDDEDYPETKRELATKKTSRTLDCEYYTVGEFLFPYILNWLKKNKWQYKGRGIFYKDNPDNDVLIFDEIEPFNITDADQADNLWDQFAYYMDYNY
jgi:hypothetical protein